MLKVGGEAMNHAIWFHRVDIINELIDLNVPLTRGHFMEKDLDNTVLDRMYTLKMQQIKDENIFSRFIKQKYYKYLSTRQL